MQVESVDIRHFGRLSDFKATFENGFNLIEGRAESGKTTLAAFITYMLYGFPATAGELPERVLRTSWDTSEASGSMVFFAAGGRYRVERTSEVTERGWRDTYLLFNLSTGQREEGELSPGERFLGVPYERFVDTATLSDLRRGGPDARSTAEAIENILFSGAEQLSSSRAIQLLTEAAKDLSSADGASGAVAVLEKERDLLKKELDIAIAAERVHFTREEELFVTRKKMDEARQEIDKFSQLETNYYNAMMIDDYDRLHALEDATDGRVAVIHAHEDAYRKEDFLPDRAYISSLHAARADVSSLKKETEEAEAALAALPKEGDVADEVEMRLIDAVSAASGEDAVRKKAKSSLKKEVWRMALGVLCSVLFLGFSVLLFRALSGGTLAPLYGALALLMLGGAVLFLVEGVREHRRLAALYTDFAAAKREEFLSNLQRAKEAKLRVLHATAERERGALRLSRAQERYSLAVKALTEILAKWGVSLSGEEGAEQLVSDTAARAEEYLSEHERLTAEHRAAETEVRALREKLKGQNEVAVRARVAPDDRKKYRNQNAGDLRRGVELYSDRLKSLALTEEELLRALASEERGEHPAAIAERVFALDTRIALMREHVSAITLAREAVEGGRERLRAEISPRLSLDACRLLYEMTDGKYSELLVSEDFSLRFDEGEGERPVGYLSHSTEDLAYYSLRLALLNLMYEEMPPITLDGCTARQDDERTLSFLRAVRTLTDEKKQCFFFASGEREARLAKSVFSTYLHIKLPD